MIVNFLTVNTSWNREKVVDFMRKIEFDTVFLDLPEHFEAYFANGMIPEVEIGLSQDLRASEPIIRFCWEEGIPIYCYLENKASRERVNAQLELARLVLRAKISKFRDLESRNESAEYIEMKIRENAGKRNACINIPIQVEKELEGDFKVERVMLYDFKRPIDRLYEIAMKELKGEKVNDEEWLRLIRRHIAFVDTVVEIGYEEACKFIWI
ncbi:MAG: hypothetical protein QXU61_03035 [Archaeoglobaceae archaeon]